MASTTSSRPESADLVRPSQCVDHVEHRPRRLNQPRGAHQLEVVRHGCALGDRFRTTPRLHSSAAQSPRGAPPYARDRQRMKRQPERQSGQARRTRFLHEWINDCNKSDKVHQPATLPYATCLIAILIQK